MKNLIPNALINETSPYLLQHAYNPVQWYPYNEETWEKARREDKLVVVSIGYSACHWCHVMERESFENQDVADVMNEHYISIKVDREERPDVDQVYMDAVQIMTGRGGWPLNVICLPDGRPFHGGTYFPLSNWMQTLIKLQEIYRSQRSKVEAFAERLTQGVQAMDGISEAKSEDVLNPSLIEKIIESWKPRWDTHYGGNKNAPKFPLPNNFLFLSKYYQQTKSVEALDFLRLTLEKMAWGGIYDTLAGGFARYSTDEYWKVPHFEKMLYDNGQLLSLYAHGYKISPVPLYLNVVEQTVDFIEKQMTSPEKGFYSAYDADSEGVEAKF